MDNAPMPSGSPVPRELHAGPLTPPQAALVRKLIHELNNALSVISINSTLLRAGAVEDEHDEMLEEIRDSSQAAATLLLQMRRWVDGAGGPGGPDHG